MKPKALLPDSVCTLVFSEWIFTAVFAVDTCQAALRG
jgi:hypothetical protein